MNLKDSYVGMLMCLVLGVVLGSIFTFTSEDDSEEVVEQVQRRQQVTIPASASVTLFENRSLAGVVIETKDSTCIYSYVHNMRDSDRAECHRK